MSNILAVIGIYGVFLATGAFLVVKGHPRFATGVFIITALLHITTGDT